jgi:hypothetical protein
MADETRWFPSKVDGWLAAILAIAPLVPMTGLFGSRSWTSPEVLLPALLGPLFFAAIYGLLVLPMRYGIGRSELVVRHGVVRRRVPLQTIASVSPTRDPLSSPALSLDRLRIATGPRPRDSILISPADRDGFLALLAERAGLARDGDRLVRG